MTATHADTLPSCSAVLQTAKSNDESTGSAADLAVEAAPARDGANTAAAVMAASASQDAGLDQGDSAASSDCTRGPAGSPAAIDSPALARSDGNESVQPAVDEINLRPLALTPLKHTARDQVCPPCSPSQAHHFEVTLVIACVSVLTLGPSEISDKVAVPLLARQ